MRFFKKVGNLKYRKTTDSKLIEDWTKQGFVEVNKSGVPIGDKPSKSKDK
tara:strand:+ start:1514 stop:1663 length:150 start_codon:yes stop_codon:yes gene_type:complete